MTAAKNGCVAIVRRVQHLDQACLMVNKRTTHFVCMSMETVLRCRERGLTVTIPSNYDQLSANFATKGQQLARRWITEVIAKPLTLSEEQETYLLTKVTFFFAMALFALELIKAVVEQHRPRKVYLWRDRERSILWNCPQSSGEGAVFAQVAAAWLAGQGISVEYLDQTVEHGTPPKDQNSLVGRLRSYISRIPKPIRPGLRCLYTLGMSLHRSIPRLKLRIHIILLQWKRYWFKRPLILFWCSILTDAVYQSELAQQWKRERGWYGLCIESHQTATLARRSRIRNGGLPLGINHEVVLDTFGTSAQKVQLSNIEKLLVQTAEWWSANCPDGECIGTNSTLVYQHRAMIQFAASVEGRMQSLSAVIKHLKPDCVVTHLEALQALAARRSSTPSMVIAHGGIVDAGFVSMHGDVNVVSGEIQKEYYEELKTFSGHLLSLGFPHIQLPQLEARLVSTFRNSSSNSLIPTVTFFVQEPDLNYWYNVNFEAYTAVCRKLRELAHAQCFRLIVKLHPRYGEVGLFKQIFLPDGEHIRLETTPSLAHILQQTDLAIFGSLTTAIMEVTAYHIPIVMFFYHYDPAVLNNPYFRNLPAGFRHAHSLHELQEISLQLLHSSAQRKEVIRSQNDFIPKMLNSYGETAARNIADVCEQFLNRNRVHVQMSHNANIKTSGRKHQESQKDHVIQRPGV